MTDKAITDLAVASALAGTELMEVVQGGVSKKTAEIAGLIPRVADMEGDTGLAAFISNESADIAEGGWPVTRSTPRDIEITRIYAEIMTGGGSATIHLLVDGSSVYGPINLAAGSPQTITGLSIVIPANSAVTFNVEDPYDVQGLWMQADGGA